MRKYSNTVTDTLGNALNAAAVTVVSYPSNGAVTVYSDDGTTVIASSIITTNSLGEFSFYAPPGRYNLQVRVAGALVNTVTDVQIDEGISEEVASTAALRALKGMGTGQFTVTTLGYYSAGDGDGGSFYWDSTSSATDNGGTIIAPDAGGTGRWKWVSPTDFVNVKRFGAKGDGTTNDQAAIQAAIDAVTTSGGTVFFPIGTYLCSSAVRHKSNVRLVGAGRDIATIKLGASANQNLIVSHLTTTIASGGGNRNMALMDLTLDGNAANQGTAFYVAAYSHIKDFTMERVKIKGIYGTGLWLNESDVAGGGAGGAPSTPDGQQFNQNVRIRDCILGDGTAQITPNSDQHVIGRCDDVVVEGCEFQGSAGANEIAFQFNKNFTIRDNKFSTFWTGLFLETNQHGLVEGNRFTTLATPDNAATPAVGIWLASANETYGSSAGYAGCKYVTVRDNDFLALTRASGSVGIRVIRLAARAGATLANLGNVITGNRVIDTGTSFGDAQGIIIEGDARHTTISDNTIKTATYGIQGGVAYSGDNGAATSTRIRGNRFDGCTTGVSLTGTNNDKTIITGNDFFDCTTTMNDFASGSGNEQTNLNVYGNIGQNSGNTDYLKEHFTVGSGVSDVGGTATRINRILSATATIDPASLADGAVHVANITVNGARTNDPVAIGWAIGAGNTVMTSAYVVSSNTVRLMIENKSGGVLDLGAANFTILVFQVGGVSG